MQHIFRAEIRARVYPLSLLPKCDGCAVGFGAEDEEAMREVFLVMSHGTGCGIPHTSACRIVAHAGQGEPPQPHRISPNSGDDTITLNDFFDFVYNNTTLDADPNELRQLFSFLDVDGGGAISASEFVWGLRHSSCLRLLARARAAGSSFRAPHSGDDPYDYSRSTQEHYATPLPEGVSAPTRTRLTAAFRRCPGKGRPPFRLA